MITGYLDRPGDSTVKITMIINKESIVDNAEIFWYGGANSNRGLIGAVSLSTALLRNAGFWYQGTETPNGIVMVWYR